MDYGELMQKAKAQIKHLPKGTEFFVKDLLSVDWLALEKRDKLNFGRYFKHAVVNGMVEKIVYVKKAANNSAIYKRL